MELFKDIELLDKEKEEYVNTFLNQIRKFDSVYLWGISESCDEAILFFQEHNIAIKGIYDGRDEEYNHIYKGIPVLPQTFDELDPNSAIVVTISYYDLFRTKLIDKYPNIDDFLFVYDGYFVENKDISYYKDNKDIIIKNYEALADDYSKELYNAVLKYRYVRNPKLIKDLYHPRITCYLDDEFINNYKDGLYIDAGSYNADFVTSLSEKVDVSNSKFYIFEPNKIFYDNIVNSLGNSFNYKAFNVALCDKEDRMRFLKLQSSTSHLENKKYNAYHDTVDSTIDYVDTKTLDSVVGDEKVTGIKIDIEGSEASMLLGATNTIKRDKPIILLSIYHRWDDLFKLQEYIMSLGVNYKYYIRHYSLSVAKTILYCIPE